MRCCICGKETEILKKGMCESCFSKEMSSFSIDNVIKLKVCKHCGAFYLNKWEHGTIRETVTKTILHHLKPKKEFEIVDRIEDIEKDQIQIEFFCREDKIKVNINLLHMDEFVIREKLFTEIVFDYTTCPTCSRIHGGYYEAIVQIRREDSILDQKEREEIMEAIEEISDENAVSKIVNKKEGIDFYFISKKTALKTIESLRAKYSGKIKKSFETCGGDKTRVVSVLKLPKYKKGMLIEHKNEIFYVEGARKSLELRTLSGERKRFLWKNINMKEFKILKDPEFEDIMITEITPKRVQIMSLKNYETSYIKRDKIPKNIKIEVKKEYRAIRREDKLEIWWDYGY